MLVIDLARFHAFLFDLDGVITRTAALHAEAWKRLFDEYLAAHGGGAFVPFDPDTDYRRYVDGKPRAAGVRSFLAARGIDLPAGTPADTADADTVQGLGKRKNRYFLALLDRQGVRVYESAVTLLRAARLRGVRTAVVSSSRNCAAILRAARLAALFDVRVDGVELDRLGLPGKPAPDMFLEAARRLAVPPGRGVLFEDATAGVEAARRGGFGLVVGVGAGEHAADLRASGADVVVADLGEIRLEGGSGTLEARA
jgi:beta-phosphoglucomutase family hydrolase